MLANLPTKLIDPSSRGQPPLNNVHCLVLNVVAAFLLGWPFPACFFLCVSVCGGYFPAWFLWGWWRVPLHFPRPSGGNLAAQIY